jgi:CubicO group peptidase (beta-lactamase class C family)
VEPTPEPLTVDTIFDLASITKPVATATAIHLLLQEGQLTLDDPVTRWLPDFGQNGKEAVTVRHLLTHTSGLIPDNALADYLQGPAKAFENIHALPLRTPAGSRFAYSDVGFLVLGELVEKVSGQSLADFTRARLFLPCGMHDTAFNPPADWRPRIAPTHKREDNWIRGEVHDPRAYALGGTAGHAGLFSTADDLARFGQMLIQQGELDGQRILEPATVTAMFQTERVSSGLRALGWDKDSPYSSNRGDLLSQAAIGHGGFTGTVFWIDPEQQLVLVFLASRLHPKGEGNVNALAGRVFTIAAAALPAPSTP